MWTFDVLTFFEVSVQVHGEQRGAGGVVGAADGPVIAAGLVFPAEVRWRRRNVLLLVDLRGSGDGAASHHFPLTCVRTA